jgi:poly(3-hydroxyalkanoate) depolymerase
MRLTAAARKPDRRRSDLGYSEIGYSDLERIRLVQVGDRMLRVATRPGGAPGPGGLPPLLLCNGIGASLELLQPFVDRLDRRREVIRFDLPGIGGSPAPVVPYHLATLPGLLVGLLDQLGHSAVDVLGISWGGGLAQQFAWRQPDRVRRLVLVATATGSLMVPAGPRVLAHMLTPRRYRDRGYAARVAPEIYGGSLREHPERASLLLPGAAPVGSRLGYYYQLLAGAGWTSLPVLPLIRQPTLVLAGDDDPIIPLINARLMAAMIPRAHLHIYRGGHLELIAEPMRLVPAIESFLDEE